MPRMTRSISAADSSGSAAARLRRARAEMPSRGPISRARAPPSAEAASIGNARIAAKNSAAPPASARSLQDGGAAGGSDPSRASLVSPVVSIGGLAQDIGEKMR